MEAPPGAAGTWVGGTRAGIPRALPDAIRSPGNGLPRGNRDVKTGQGVRLMRIAATSGSPVATPPRELLAGEPGSPVASSADPRFAHFKVIRRNGAVVGFEPAKISIAMTKAFLAVNGGQGAGSARVRDEVAKLTDAVVMALLKRKPDGGAIHIEEIQDQ